MEIERKFLIQKPNEEELKKMSCTSVSQVIQTYLLSENPLIERRVRQRGMLGKGYQFYYTEKEDVSMGVRKERESEITPEKYFQYLLEADTNLQSVNKTRYCFEYQNRTFELDIYPFSKQYAILEIELSDLKEEIKLPPLTIVKEVTEDKRYRNRSLASGFTF